jgi:hypothetical protein
MFLAFVLAMIIATPSSYAQYDRMKKKAQKNEYKTKMKQFKKEGWTIYGSSHSLDVALLEHYQKLDNDDAQELVGVASSFISKNIGKQAAMNSACNEYARQAQSFVRGRVISDMFNNADDVPAEFDKFYAAYESVVAKEIKGELKPSFSIIRSKGMQDGKEVFEMQTFFIVNEKEASRARMAALQNALKESEMAQDYATRVANFVQEGFDLESGE